MKPFAELSMVKRLLEHSSVQQFRYFKVLIQEFHVKVDIVFLNSLMALFESDEANDTQEVGSFYYSSILVILLMQRSCESQLILTYIHRVNFSKLI